MISDDSIPETPARFDDLGQRLRRHRELLGISRQELARRLGITIQKLGNIERGESDLSLGLFCRIACALDCKPGDLLNTLLFAREWEKTIDPMEIKQFALIFQMAVSKTVKNFSRQA